MAEMMDLKLTPEDIHPYLKAQYPHMYRGNDDWWCKMREEALVSLLKHYDVDTLLKAQLAKAEPLIRKEVTEEWKQKCEDLVEARDKASRKDEREKLLQWGNGLCLHQNVAGTRHLCTTCWEELWQALNKGE